MLFFSGNEIKGYSKLSHYLYPKGGMCCNYYNSHTRQFTERGCNCSFSKDGQINSSDFAYKSASILGSTTPAAQKVWKRRRVKASEERHRSTDGGGNQCGWVLQTSRRQGKGC